MPLVALALLLTEHSAGASALSIRLAELLRQAQTVSVVRVEGVDDAGIVATVIRAYRGPAAGTRHRYRSTFHPRPAKGDVLLAICHPSFCPVLAKAARGLFVFAAQNLFSKGPLLVMPPAIERRPVDAIVKGKTPAALQARLEVRYYAPSPNRATFALTVDPTTGKGTATSTLLPSPTPWPAELTFYWIDGQLQFAATVVRTSRGEYVPHVFRGAAIARDAAKRLTLEGYGTQPLVRSRKSLRRLLRGPHRAIILARGTLSVRKANGPLKAGRYRATLATDGDSSDTLLLHTALGGQRFARPPQQVDRDAKRTRLAFPLRRSNTTPSYPQLLFDLGDVSALPRSFGEAPYAAYRFARGRQLSTVLYLQQAHGQKPIAVGKVVLRAVAP